MTETIENSVKDNEIIKHFNDRYGYQTDLLISGFLLSLYGRWCQTQNLAFAEIGALFTYVLSKKKRSIRSANHKQLFN